MANRPTLADIAAMESDFLTPEEVCGVLGCTPYSISVMAETADGRDALGFNVIRIGKRTKIPRRSFLDFMGWQEARK